MRAWHYLALALAVGGLAALVALLAVSPPAAFAAGALLVALAAALIGPRRAAAPAPAPPEAAPGGMPTGFGRALIEKLPTPLLVISRTGRIVYANPAAHDVLPRLQAGEHFASLIRAPAFVEAVAASLGDGEERVFQFTTHQGRERFYEARIGLLPADGSFGPEAQAIVQLEDRTQARRAEELRSDFIANASHELRTPLASVIGYIETLQHHARDDVEARERFLGIMAREARRMQRMVDDLMSLSRIEMTEHLRPVERMVAAADRARGRRGAAAGRGGAGDDARDRARARGRAGVRRPRPARPGLRQPDRQRDEVRPRERNGARLRRAAEPRLSQPPRRDGRGRRARHRPRAHPPPDRALLPGERRLQPGEGRHRARPRHRQAHPEPPRRQARDHLGARARQRLHRVAARRSPGG